RVGGRQGKGRDRVSGQHLCPPNTKHRFARELPLTPAASAPVRTSNRYPVVRNRQWVTTIGSPFLYLTLFTFQAPPGAPLRSGSTLSCSSSPGFKVLLVQPSRMRPLGAPPSRLQTWLVPSCSLTSRMMKACGAVYFHSFTTPTRSIGCS